MEKKRMNLMEFIGTEEGSKSFPPKKRGATEKMISFATAIADTLDLDYPNFEDFSETSEFISYNKDDYYEAKEENEEDDEFPF